jgi:hypothetical protein
VANTVQKRIAGFGGYRSFSSCIIGGKSQIVLAASRNLRGNLRFPWSKPLALAIQTTSYDVLHKPLATTTNLMEDNYFYKKFKKHPDSELKKILNSPDSYSDEAIIAASHILKEREIQLSDKEESVSSSVHLKKKETSKLKPSESWFKPGIHIPLWTLFCLLTVFVFSPFYHQKSC